MRLALIILVLVFCRVFFRLIVAEVMALVQGLVLAFGDAAAHDDLKLHRYLPHRDLGYSMHRLVFIMNIEITVPTGLG
jgi:hypothetical protein